MANNETWNRDELYGEVWATPMKTLAKKYGISDVGLAKTCRKLAIPLPGRGYWAKKEAGQEVKQPPLPPLKERVLLFKPTPRPASPALSDFAKPEELALVERLEQASGAVSLKHGSLSHPLILQAREAFGTQLLTITRSGGLGKPASISGCPRITLIAPSGSWQG